MPEPRAELYRSCCRCLLCYTGSHSSVTGPHTVWIELIVVAGLPRTCAAPHASPLSPLSLQLLSRDPHMHDAACVPRYSSPCHDSACVPRCSPCQRSMRYSTRWTRTAVARWTQRSSRQDLRCFLTLVRRPGVLNIHRLRTLLLCRAQLDLCCPTLTPPHLSGSLPLPLLFALTGSSTPPLQHSTSHCTPTRATHIAIPRLPPSRRPAVCACAHAWQPRPRR